MVNFKLGEETRKDGIFNMSRAWDKEKSESPTGIALFFVFRLLSFSALFVFICIEC